IHTERKKTTGVLSIIYLIATAVIALGYSIFYVEVKLPNGSTGQLLDIMDYISNSFLMPFISLLSAILIGWIIKPSWIVEEMELNGKKFSRKKLYNVMIRYIMPVIMVILFLQSTGFLNVLISKIQNLYKIFKLIKYYKIRCFKLIFGVPFFVDIKNVILQ
ncbi:MAG: hypothetical protein ACLR1A_07315, partial [Eubacterium ventriosum]